MDPEKVSATLDMPVPADRVFAVLADPATHAAIDGTSSLRHLAELATQPSQA